MQNTSCYRKINKKKGLCLLHSWEDIENDFVRCKRCGRVCSTYDEPPFDLRDIFGYFFTFGGVGLVIGGAHIAKHISFSGGIALAAIGGLCFLFFLVMALKNKVHISL